MESLRAFFSKVAGQCTDCFKFVVGTGEGSSFSDQIVGSDTQTGSSPLYVWGADQFGHIFLGLGCVFLLVWLISAFAGMPAPSYGLRRRTEQPNKALPSWVIWVCAALVFCGWFVKELGDLAGAGVSVPNFISSSLVTIKLTSGARAVAAEWLPASWVDLKADFYTDLAFYTIGILLALVHFGALGLRRTWAPILAFLVLLVGAAGISCYWLPVWRALGETNIPHLARLSQVTLRPASPSNDVTNVLADEGPPKECTSMESLSQPALQCILAGDCKSTHFFIYGLTEQDMPRAEAAPRLEAGAINPDSPLARAAAKVTATKSKRVVAMMTEIRKLGIAITAEQVMRGLPQDPRFTTLVGSIAGGLAAGGESTKFLIIDNLERDLTRLALSTSGGDKVPTLTKILSDEIKSFSETFASRSVIWLSLNERTAVATCTLLFRNSAENFEPPKVTLIRATLPEARSRRRIGSPGVDEADTQATDRTGRLD